MPYAHVFSVIASHIEFIVSNGGYPILFIMSTLEGLPLVGMLVPGHLAVFVAGFFARIGTLDLWMVIAIAVTGAIVGDYIGFRIGRRYGMRFIERLRPYFFIKDSHIEKARSLLSRHTGKSMVIGRFSPVTRALMPFLVGASETPEKRFWLFNVIGAVSWSVSSILIGYAFGEGYKYASGLFGKAVVIAILAAFAIAWGYRFVNLRFHVFKKYELFVLGLNIVSLWVLVKTVQDAWSVHLKMLPFDLWVNTAMAGLDPYGFLVSMASIVSNVGGTAVTGILGIGIGLYLAWKKKWRSSLVLISSMGVTGVLVGIMKEFFMRARPENALQVVVNDPSFPSGHSALAAAFFFAVAYLLAPRIRSWVKRESMIAACVLSAALVGISRTVLNVHWASDVMAGWALGVFVTSGSILFIRYIGALLVKKASAE